MNQSIQDLHVLPAGWDYGKGEKISNEVLEIVDDLNYQAELMYLDIEALPNTDGGVTVNLSRPTTDLFFVVTISPDCSLCYCIEKGKGFEYEVLQEDTQVANMPRLRGLLTLFRYKKY